MASCGDLVIPEGIAVLNPREAFCEKHGWVALERKAKLSEWMIMELGTEPYSVPDEPPF